MGFVLKAIIVIAAFNVSLLSEITPEKRAQWEANGFSFGGVSVPKENLAIRWVHAGFDDPEEAKKWRFVDSTDNGKFFDPAEAKTWKSAGVNDPVTSFEFIESGFLPEESFLWISNGIDSYFAKIFKDAGLIPDVAKEWIKTGIYAGDIVAWINSGTAPVDAQRWYEAGFATPNNNFKKWKMSGIKPEAAHLCDELGLDTGDVSGFPNAVDPLSIAVGKENGYSKQQTILLSKKLSKYLSGQFRNQDEIDSLNPYEIKGAVFLLTCKHLQLLDKYSGLYSLTDGNGSTVWINFYPDPAPKNTRYVIGKGLEPFKYNSTFGEKKIIPSFHALLQMKISEELMGRLTDHP
jgi:hypothetical protein